MDQQTTTYLSKRCNKCGVEKSLSEFNTIKCEARPHPYCRQCHRTDRLAMSTVLSNAAFRVTGHRGIGGGTKWATLSLAVRRSELAKQRLIESVRDVKGDIVRALNGDYSGVTREKYYKDNPETKRKANAKRNRAKGANTHQRERAVPTTDQRLIDVRNRKRASLRTEKRALEAGEKGEGFVYVVSNKAWPSWVKVGMAVDYEKRLSQFNTGSPARDYVMHFAGYFKDAAKAEARTRLLLMWDHGGVEGEWHNVPVEAAIHCIQTVQCEHNEHVDQPR